MGVLTSKPVQVSPLSLGFPTLYTVLLANAGTSAELSALDDKGMDFKSDPSPMRNQPTIGRVPCDRKSAGSKVCPPHFGEMPSELRPSAGLSSWASATPAENSANLQRAARWCGAKAAPQANTRLRGYLSWWGSDRRGHGQTAWHGAHHHGQRQHRAPTAGAGVGNALLRNTAELLTWRHCPATTTSASAIRRCCAALTRGSLFFLLVFLLVLLRFIANLHRRIQFPPAQFLISGHIRPSQKPPSPIGAGLFFALYRVTGHHGILCWSNFPGHLDRCNPPGRGI